MPIDAFAADSSELYPGINLIEASAGTGKTYTIAMLVLRFVVEKDVDIKELLVVTFTKAATEELKERIRQRLAETKQLIISQSPNHENKVLANWLANLNLEKALILRRLDKALLDVDQAAIFTIHGFCQRVLLEHALESGQMFDCELSGDISAIRQNCCADFWRKQVYLRPAWQVNLLTATFATPTALLNSIKSINPQQSIYPQDTDLDVLLNSLEELLAAAHGCLPTLLEQLDTVLAAGYFNGSFQQTVTAHTPALVRWLADPSQEIAEFSWLTGVGLYAGLNSRKFLVSKAKPLASELQKQNYLDSLGLDCRVFEQLLTTLQMLQVAFRCALLDTLRSELDCALQKNNVLSFDDLITRLAAALTGEKAALLIPSLQLRLKVGLIDDFQDTDQLQWQIFATIFSAANQYLYLIGDPKQAIYKFRGADIYSYFSARQQANYRYTLLHNWRSQPTLVAAVNHLFSREHPFLLPKLDFNPVHAGLSEQAGYIAATPPLVFWQLDKNPANVEHWTTAKAGLQIRNAVVNEILQLLDNTQINRELDDKQESRPLLAQDIAILVRSNTQAFDYQQALQAVGIPAVLNSKQSVFSTPQAQEIYIVLQAVAQPGNITTLKQALTLNWFQLDGQALYKLSNDEQGLDNWLTRFQDYYEVWQQRGLLAMMYHLLQQEQVEQHLSRLDQAERVLTNIYHIIERIQQASMDEQLVINKTLNWLQRAIQQAEQDSGDDRQLRLESDADAVRIVTLHSAKGLEYPVVFCPTLWQRSERLKKEQLLVHCHENGQMIADLGSAQFAERKQTALYEELAEDLRLFYVAVTRAKYRCYLSWADVRTKEHPNDSALAYLLGFAHLNFSEQQQKLQAIAQTFPQQFAYHLLPNDKQISDIYQAKVTKPHLSYRPFNRQLSTTWLMSSYTALSALSQQFVPELPEDKAVETNNDVQIESYLPKGAQMGNVVHSLLEKLSFQRLAQAEDYSKDLAQTLSQYGVQLDAPELVTQLLQTVTHSALSTDTEFCLKNIAAPHCIKEMPFYLSMSHLDTDGINQILADSPTYQPLSHKQLRGYLTGFIDLICCYQGQYYVMDYKTNCLADYQPETILTAMREHNYGLQYWLYSVVLDAYLQQRLTAYNYQQHFGGVKYLFVRGMHPARPGYAVYADKPMQHKLKALANLLMNKENS